MRFARTLRLDISDLRIFPAAAAPGEWAVPGSFAFLHLDPAALDGKERLAFGSGWLGIESFGRSSLVEVAEIDESAFFAVVERLARHFVERYGAPDLAAALPMAREEADYAASLCAHKLNTLLALERAFDEDGNIRERFRVIHPGRAEEHAKIWEILDEPE